MPRFITTDDGLSVDDRYDARGEHFVLLEPAAQGPALHTATSGWATWGNFEGLPAMALGDWILVTTWGATLDKDVDNTIFDDKYVGLKKTSLLWSVYLSNGLVVPTEPISQAALLKRIEAAAAKAPPADLVITQDDLDDCQARPPRPPPTGLGAPVGTGTGTDRSSRARATTGTASTTPAPPPTAPGYHDVAPQVTYGDLIRSDRKAQTVARMEYNLGTRVATAHRTPDTPCAKM